MTNLQRRWRHRGLVVLACAGWIGGCDEYEFPEDATMIAVGDSILSWHKEDGDSIPEVAGRELGAVMGNASEPGAPLLGDDDWTIPNQYRSGPWSWVVINGGANDLMDECDCRNCGSVMDRILSADGTAGELRRLADRAVSEGARVAVVGYMNLLPDSEESPRCNDELDTLHERQRAMTDAMPNAVYVSAAEVMDGTDARMYDDDKLHPSVRGSRGVGLLLAETMAEAEAQMEADSE